MGLRRWLGALRGRREAPPALAPETVSALCAELPLLASLDAAARERLGAMAGEFLHRKSIEPAGGLMLDESECAMLAAQAVLPVLGLGLHWYRGWQSLIVYPDEFVAPLDYTDMDGVVHQGMEPRSGEAWPQGPVVVAWEEVRGCAHGELWGNVLVHEMAHKLDLQNGDANGMPPLHAGMSRERWTRAMSEAFARLRRGLDRGRPDLLGEYAAQDPGEFFAVASEAFFTAATELASAYPAVYTELEAFYRQDPREGATRRILHIQ